MELRVFFVHGVLDMGSDPSRLTEFRLRIERPLGIQEFDGCLLDREYQDEGRIIFHWGHGYAGNPPAGSVRIKNLYIRQYTKPEPIIGIESG